MGRIIINYEKGISPYRAVRVVDTVMAEGKILESLGAAHYCLVTKFQDCVVTTLKKKLRNGVRQELDSFWVRTE